MAVFYLLLSIMIVRMHQNDSGSEPPVWLGRLCEVLSKPLRVTPHPAPREETYQRLLQQMVEDPTEKRDSPGWRICQILLAKELVFCESASKQRQWPFVARVLDKVMFVIALALNVTTTSITLLGMVSMV